MGAGITGPDGGTEALALDAVLGTLAAALPRLGAATD